MGLSNTIRNFFLPHRKGRYDLPGQPPKIDGGKPTKINKAVKKHVAKSETDRVKLINVEKIDEDSYHKTTKKLKDRTVRPSSDISALKGKIYRYVDKSKISKLLSHATKEKIRTTLDALAYDQTLSLFGKRDLLVSDEFKTEVQMKKLERLAEDHKEDESIRGREIRLVAEALIDSFKTGEDTEGDPKEVLRERFLLLQKAKRLGIADINPKSGAGIVYDTKPIDQDREVGAAYFLSRHADIGGFNDKSIEDLDRAIYKQFGLLEDTDANFNMNTFNNKLSILVSIDKSLKIIEEAYNSQEANFERSNFLTKLKNARVNLALVSRPVLSKIQEVAKDINLDKNLPQEWNVHKATKAQMAKLASYEKMLDAALASCPDFISGEETLSREAFAKIILQDTKCMIPEGPDGKYFARITLADVVDRFTSGNIAMKKPDDDHEGFLIYKLADTEYLERQYNRNDALSIQYSDGEHNKLARKAQLYGKLKEGVEKNVSRHDLFALRKELILLETADYLGVDHEKEPEPIRNFLLFLTQSFNGMSKNVYTQDTIFSYSPQRSRDKLDLNITTNIEDRDGKPRVRIDYGIDNSCTTTFLQGEEQPEWLYNANLQHSLAFNLEDLGGALEYELLQPEIPDAIPKTEVRMKKELFEISMSTKYKLSFNKDPDEVAQIKGQIE